MRSGVGASLTLLASALCATGLSAQQPAALPGITRTELVKQALPPGDFRNVQAAVIELAPGAVAPLHRHDVAVLVYVLEGETENRFDGGAARIYRAGESWWEAPGTVHDLARNPSTTARSRFLVVYIGEEGKANSVPLDSLRRPVPPRPQLQSEGATTIYFVRHGEVDPAQPTFPLNQAGKLRAQSFRRTVGDIGFTHIFSSHTTRARQMVEPVAQASRLPVEQLPRPGTTVAGAIVADSTPARVAVAPLVQALRALPRGSTALVGVNSDNIYALLNGMGVPVATVERPCLKGNTCVPCLTRDCFPGGEDQLWILVVGSGTSSPTLIQLRY